MIGNVDANGRSEMERGTFRGKKFNPGNGPSRVNKEEFGYNYVDEYNYNHENYDGKSGGRKNWVDFFTEKPTHLDDHKYPNYEIDVGYN